MQFYGDGCLLTFDNSTGAVHCALALQKGFREVPVRIGIHLGDVVFSDGNVFGDGVNLASRVESLGVPGTVLLSKTVRDQIRNKDDLELVSLGLFDFKNVDEPVQVYALANEPLRVPKRSELKGKLKASDELYRPWFRRKRHQRTARNIVIYVLLAWLVVESFALWIQDSGLDPELINLLVIVAVFGLLSTLVYSRFRKRFNLKAVAVHIAILLLAAISLGYYILHITAFDPGALRLVKLTTEKDGPLASLSSLAVLPFSNLMNDPEQDYLVAGLHDGLISEIGKLGNIRVISRTSTLPFTEGNTGLPRIARALDVEAIIEGTLTRVDTMVDLRLKLIDVFPKEETIWTHEYQTSFAELPNMYRQATRQIALKLNEVVAPAEQRAEMGLPTVDPEAYRAYLRGNYLTGMLSAQGYDRAETYFRRAMDIDPNFSGPYSGLATIVLAKRQKYLISLDSANQTIRDLLDRAGNIGEENAELWKVVGSNQYTTFYDWAASEEAFLRSIAINPNLAGTRSSYAHLLMILNRWEEAWEQLAYAEALDPKNPWTIGFSAVMYANSGQILTAFKKFDQLTELAPDNPMANFSNLMKHSMTLQYGKAMEDLKARVAYIGMQDLHPHMDSIYHQDGFMAAVQSTADTLEARREHTFIAPSYMIRFYGPILQDREKFIYYLQQMYVERDPDLPYFGIRGVVPFQDDPRYVKVMEDIGLW